MDLKRYNKKKFHRDPSVNRKIEALFLLFDKRCEDYKVVTDKQRVLLLNLFINNLAKYEEYEVAKSFKDRKIRLYKKIRKAKRKWSINLIFRLYKFKITRFLRGIFK